MAKRDPEVTYHNREADKLSEYLKTLEPEVVRLSGRDCIASVHAAYGGKHDEFIDIKNAVISTPQEFVALWLDGYMQRLREVSSGSAIVNSFKLLQEHDVIQKYVFAFLERTYHRHFRSLSKERPKDEEAFYWIGQERAAYGLFITPRFRRGNWENDKSEIRHFRKHYWTIGHILQTGLVVPFKEEVIKFNDVEQYLTFFKNVLVRLSGSPHEMAIAEKYCAFVRAAQDPEIVPLLIPEIRYGGIEKNHEYRLDFCVIRQDLNQKIGFELSPWSTHGYLSGLKGKTQAEINELAKGNFQDEMGKVKNFFRHLGIVVLIFTDQDLANSDKVFEEIARFLEKDSVTTQLKLSVIEDFKNFRI